MRRLIFVACMCCVCLSFGQMDDSYFSSPIDHPIRLSGSFGELRTSHFHTGIDIKSSKGAVGDPVYSVADGCISRIKIQAAGYGQALYIDHPNGLTSVYGHLHELRTDIADWVRDQQFSRQKFEVNLHPDSCLFPVKKRDQIGKMGNSGYSFGPHLHFELRNTRTEKAVNPTFYDFVIRDEIPPLMRRLAIYTLDEKFRTRKSELIPVVKSKEYRIKGDTLLVPAWRIGLGLDVLDKMNATPNRNDIYKLELKIDDQLFYQFTLDSLDFETLRFINAHRDYPAFQKYKSRIHKLFILPGNKLDNYADGLEKGIIPIFQDKKRKVEINAWDHRGNKSTFICWIKRDPNMPGYERDVEDYTILFNEPNVINTPDFNVQFKEGTWYTDARLNLEQFEENSTGVYSRVHALSSEDAPLNKPMNVRIRPNASIDTNNLNKYFIAVCEKDAVSDLGGSWQDGYLVTNTSSLGQFSIRKDEKAPTIRVTSFPSTLRKGRKATFYAKDETIGGKLASRITYDGYIDDNWTLVEYDYKNDLLTCRFLESLAPGKHTFKLIVTDAHGNESIFTKNFEWVE